MTLICPQVGDGVCYESNDLGVCNCLIGTPYFDAQGICRCDTAPGLLGPPIRDNVNPCRNHQALPGYRFFLVNGVCRLVRLSTGEVLNMPTTSNDVLMSPTTSSSSIQNWISQNKGLAVVLGLATAYFFMSDK